MVAVIITVFCVAALRALPRLLVEAIATTVAVAQAIASRRAHLALIGRGVDQAREPSSWDRRPTASDRRLLKRSLRVAMRQTGSTSLFPLTARRAHRIVDTISRQVG